MLVGRGGGLRGTKIVNKHFVKQYGRHTRSRSSSNKRRKGVARGPGYPWNAGGGRVWQFMDLSISREWSLGILGLVVRVIGCGVIAVVT